LSAFSSDFFSGSIVLRIGLPAVGKVSRLKVDSKL
jgi:hypothetical protein